MMQFSNRWRNKPSHLCRSEWVLSRLANRQLGARYFLRARAGLQVMPREMLRTYPSLRRFLSLRKSTLSPSESALKRPAGLSNTIELFQECGH